MKKIIFIGMAAMSLLFTSCFSTRYVSAEPELKKNFRNTTVEEVKFELGEPETVEDVTNGGYTYTYQIEADKNKRRNAGRRNSYAGKDDYYITFLFDKNGMVRGVQSNQLVRRKQFSAGKTVFTILFFTLILPAGIISAATAASN